MSPLPTKSKGLRICIVTDAWQPQVNGVVRTLESLRQELRRDGHKVLMLSPKLFKTLPCPTYPEIRLSVNAPFRVGKILSRFKPDAIHIATEGPLGWIARHWCIKNKMAFTTAYHTAFPEYIAARSPFPASLLYPLFRLFHKPSAGVLVATETVRQQLADKGFCNITPWTRGVDTGLFQPRQERRIEGTGDVEGPIQLYVGRVAVEKNIEAFLACPTPGTKVVVGDGPALDKLKGSYPGVKFLGAKFGKELADIYAAADVFVFPSKTDTFGLVIIEALASGTPVAAYPVQGPLDVVGRSGAGPDTETFSSWTEPVAALNVDLSMAIEEALKVNRDACREFAHFYDWTTVSQQFVSALCVNGR